MLVWEWILYSTITHPWDMAKFPGCRLMPPTLDLFLLFFLFFGLGPKTFKNFQKPSNIEKQKEKTMHKIKTQKGHTNKHTT